MQQNTSKFASLSALKPAQFKRLTGVRRETFDVMVTILRKAEKAKRRRGGVTSKLCIEDRLLLALEYLREYRTYFHVGQNYGVSEGYAFKVHRWVENTLIKDKRFALPGRKALLKSDMVIEVALVDASESPIERPKKDKDVSTQARRNGTRSRHSLSSTSTHSK
jgi:hypothetical protein